MDKDKLREFVLGLIDEIEELKMVVIWEYSANIRGEEEGLKQKIEMYKKELDELLGGMEDEKKQ